MDGLQEEALVTESVAFRAPGYVYAIPPASSRGHRAEDWDVNKWIAEVEVKLVVRSDDTAAVVLQELESGELYAQAPLSSATCAACCEPVVDSSRYYALKVQDEASKRHAFLGLGFRAREASSDFRMALAEYVKSCGRSEEAARRASSATPSPLAALGDLSLKATGSLHVAAPALARKPSLPAGGLRLPPPPAPGLTPPPAVRLAPPPPASTFPDPPPSSWIAFK